MSDLEQRRFWRELGASIREVTPEEQAAARARVMANVFDRARVGILTLVPPAPAEAAAELPPLKTRRGARRGRLHRRARR
jgi:hypothetical protein